MSSSDQQAPSTVEIFDSFLPLPFRILSLLNLAAWLWYLTLEITNSYQIKLLSLLKLHDEYPHTVSNANLFVARTFRGEIVRASVISTVGYLAYLLAHEIMGGMGIFWDCYGLILIAVFLLSFVLNSGPGSLRLRQTLKRVLIGDIDSINLRTNDILVSDTMISYGKVFIDLGVVMCQIISGESCFPALTTDEKNIDRSCGKNIALEFLVGSIPILIRMKQCSYEFKISGFMNKGHMFNFIKYSISLVFLFVTVFLTQHSSYASMWKLISFVNSCYGFYWDLNRDWNLFGSGYTLRSKRLYPVIFYYAAIGFDFFGRFVWLFKLTSTDRYLNVILYQSEVGVYLLQILEITRRFVWILVKCEIDYIVMDPLDRKADDVEMSSLPK
ncbi:hypothetical protein WICPIJ_003710 [Wickerhamomyces pijperi]|uniref:EXS domain-containing protein n=1 Tax=Wickerhamomyces pijperi TaxID=599730 RepID=A0A9P8Q6X9_WICPI|nr:hypothetical protein WICPIJ_003710 [Wickerhamomyces pijperi]